MHPRQQPQQQQQQQESAAAGESSSKAPAPSSCIKTSIKESMTMTCWNCGNEMMTRVDLETSPMRYIVGTFSLCIPFCIKGCFQEATHKCRRCGSVVAKTTGISTD